MGAVKPLHIVVSGAAGYLGRRIVAQAEARGHRVSALVRSGDGLAQDLAAADAVERLRKQLSQADAVIHAASEMSGDFAVHQASSLPAMRNICALATELGAHLVHLSSIVIYDFTAIPEGETVTESSPIEHAPELRDGYVQAKLAQEEITADLCPSASVLRIGAVFGPERIMNAHLGIGVGPVLLRLADRGQIPLAHADMVAEIAVQAAETRASGAVNVIGSDLPDRIRFIEALAQSGWPKLVIPAPWKLFAAAAACLSIWKGRPGLLRRAVLHARMKPLAYANTLMTSTFAPQSDGRFAEQMREALQNG